MKNLFISRRRHEAILAELRIVHSIELDEVRGQRDAAVEDAKRARADRDAFKDAADSANEKYTDTAIVNECLTEELARAREEIAELKAQLSDSATAHWSAEARRQKKRADRLQRQYDDAVGLKPGGIEDSRPWQPGYVDPKKAAS